MNYDDSLQQQQQQYYMQMSSQQQPRMGGVPIPMQSQHQHVQPTIQQQQAIRQPAPFGMIHPHQQGGVMVRMPLTLGEDPNTGGHIQQQQLRDMIESFPPNIQNQINSERDPERKKHLIQTAFKQHQQMFDMQQGVRMQMMNVSQQRMPISGGIAYSGQPIGMAMQQAPPVQIQRIPSQGSFSQSPGQSSQQIPQIYMSNQMAPIRTPMQSIPISQPYHIQQQQQFHQKHQPPQAQIISHHQQQLQKQTVPIPITTNAVLQNQHQKNMTTTTAQIEPQIAPTPSGKTSAGHQMRKTASSQILQHLNSNSNIQPASNQEQQTTMDTETTRPQNTMDQQLTTGAGTPLSMGQQQQQSETENPEYKALLEKLRQYHADVKRLLDRLNIDNPDSMKLKSSLINVIQVMEGTRKGGPVTKDLLRKLLSNVQTVLEQYSISRHLVIAANKLDSIPACPRETLMIKEPLFTDPWKDVRHLQIRIPEGIPQMSVDNGNRKDEMRLKGMSDPVEQAKESSSLLATITESFSNESSKTTGPKLYKMKCLDGSELVLNAAISFALDEATRKGFLIKFDEDRRPISTNTLTVKIRMEFHQDYALEFEDIAPSLNLLIPVDYPRSAIQILPEHPGTQISGSPFYYLMEKIDSGMLKNHLMEDIVDSWIKCIMEASQ